MEKVSVPKYKIFSRLWAVVDSFRRLNGFPKTPKGLRDKYTMDEH